MGEHATEQRGDGAIASRLSMRRDDPMQDTLSDRVRERIREEMTAKKLSQRDLAGILEWSQGRVAKLMTGRVKITVDDLAALCFAVSIQPSEAVRDRGLEFFAEMTPTELRILEKLRSADKGYYDAILTILHVRPSLTAERYATKPHPPGAKFGKARPK